MSTDNPSEKPPTITSISDADLGQISAGSGSDPELRTYDKKDLESIIKRAEAAGDQELGKRMTLELLSRSPEEPYARPIIWED